MILELELLLPLLKSEDEDVEKPSEEDLNIASPDALASNYTAASPAGNGISAFPSTGFTSKNAVRLSFSYCCVFYFLHNFSGDSYYDFSGLSDAVNVSVVSRVL